MENRTAEYMERRRMELIEALTNADKLLAQMVVSGDNVLLLAAARSALKQAYIELTKEGGNGTSENGER